SVFVVFFFSSRRRHTRFSRDWSSDVCSSDLASLSPEAVSLAEEVHPPTGFAPVTFFVVPDQGAVVARFGMTDAPSRVHDPGGGRSEERRVGKECRARWAEWD